MPTAPQARQTLAPMGYHQVEAPEPRDAFIAMAVSTRTAWAKQVRETHTR